MDTGSFSGLCVCQKLGTETHTQLWFSSGFGGGHGDGCVRRDGEAYKKLYYSYVITLICQDFCSKIDCFDTVVTLA